ncbi:MAG: protein kinase [Oligoflexia bacterium]|nr:protein kinase [Oligoflexia bacterium]
MADTELETPSQIGPFRVVRALARGGMAAVYEVIDPDTKDRFALKLLTQHGLARPRFDREYRALTRLDHPDIVRVYRFGFSDDNRPYLTMELLDGVAAQVHARSCGRPGNARRTAEVVRIVTHVADALDYLHQRDIIHRDLKSSNVMVLPDGRVKLLDFGTARLRGQTEEITRKGEFVGTFAYASPEQLQGHEVDARADIYSLGVLFYRLLTGKRPFEADSPHALAMLHIEQDPRPPRELATGLPQVLNDLVLQMLAKRPELRPSSTREVADRLRDYAQPDGARARRKGPLPPTLVGREEALAVVRAAIEDARPGGMMLLVGPSGSGCRRLLDQTALDAHRKGRRVFRGEMPGGSALGPIAEIVTRAVRGLPDPPDGRSESDIVTKLPRGTLPSLAQQAEISQAVWSALKRRQAADGRPMVISLSELHRAPPLAIHALHGLCATALQEDVPVLILASTVPEADRPGSLMRRQFADAVRIPMGPLTPRQVGQLVGSMLGRTAPPPELARRIHDATGGLPGYVEEVVRAMVADGLVEHRTAGPDAAAWVDRSGGRIAIPSSARDLLSLRLQALSGHARRVIGALAVAGGVSPTPLLAHAADLDPDSVCDLLAGLADDGLVVAKADSGWSFHLGLTADLVNEAMRPTRRLVFERRLAEQLRDAPPSLAKLRLLLAAGDLGQAVQDSVTWAHPQLDQLQGTDVLPGLEQVAAAIRDGSDLPASLLALFYLCIARALVDRDPNEARVDGYLDRAGALASGWARKAEVFLQRAHVARLRGDNSGERASISRARGLMDHVPDPALRLDVHLAAGRRAQADGDYKQALDLYRDAQRAAEQGGDLRGATVARARSGLVRFGMGELATAERTLQGAIDAFERLGDLGGGWLARGWLTETYSVQGRFSEATAQLLPDLDRIRATAPPDLHARALVHVVNVLLEMFRLGEARELLAELRAIEMVGQEPGLRARRALVQGRLLLAGDEALQALSVLQPAQEQAEAAELLVEHALLMAWSGVAVAATGDTHQSDDKTRRAVDILRREHNLPALAVACQCRAAVARAFESPDISFRPVTRWMDGQPARVTRMAWLLARVDYAVAQGDGRLALASVERAERLLEDIGTRLDAADRAALRVHPWRRRLTRIQADLGGGD